MFHVLVGEQAAEEPLRHAAVRSRSVTWIVPKAARVGDQVALYFPHAGFLARGTVVSLPVSCTFGRRPAYSAEVGELTLFAAPVPLAPIAERLPGWGWARYPRSFTTPSKQVASRLDQELAIWAPKPNSRSAAEGIADE